ncbi:MAG: NADH-quinone oxidoreductase subunit N [Candidatus Acidiferrales bacterium]
MPFDWQSLLEQTRMGLPLILPEVQLAFFGLAILLTDFLLDEHHKSWNALTAMLGVIFSGVSLWMLRGVPPEGIPGYNNSIVADPFFVFFGFIFLIATALVILLSARYLEIEAEHHGEYYALILFSAVGMMFLACGNDLIVLFLGLETMALSFYILTGFLRHDRRSNEGALKYVLLGAFSSGVLAYGFSILYGISGAASGGASTNLADIRAAVAARPSPDALVLLALVTVAAGVFFKIAAVPFHQWAPDVYEGAPTSITAYVSVASKAASFALVLRLFTTVFWPTRVDWTLLIAAVAVLSMTLGNIAAITQSNIKRLLAYSSISHVGYILLGLVAGNALGMKAMLYYLLVYAFFNTGAFAIVIVLRRKGIIGDQLEDLNGLIERSPGAAILMLIFLLSLAGIPPTAGFIGKLLIFWALIETQHYVLAVLAVLYILPAVYYYFRMVAAMWAKEAPEEPRIRISLAQGCALAAMVIATLAAGIYPEPFVQFAKYASSSLLPFIR